MQKSEKKNIIQGEVNSIIRINDFLRADYLCVPPYGSITGEWISQAFQIQEPEKLKYHVTKEVALPWQRAYQTTHLYHQLDIFKPFSYILDVATMTFLEGNLVCSYLSLLPVLEGVLIRWDRENGNNGEDKISTRLVDSIFSDMPNHFDLNIHLHNFLKIQSDFLHDVLRDDFFHHGTKYINADPKRERFFNRNVTSHMFREPKYTESGLNAVNIFLLLDIIAELYVHSRKDKYPHLTACRFNKKIYPDALSKYFSLYVECARRGLEDSLINRLHNTCYTSEKILD